MQNKIPNFTYCPANASNGYVTCIEMEGETIHEARNLDEFYEEFGFTADTRKSGVIAEEFIWDEYTNNDVTSSAGCIKIRLIGYLLKYSETFRMEYGAQCEHWLTNHAKEAMARNIACIACRMESLCEI